MSSSMNFVQTGAFLAAAAISCMLPNAEARQITASPPAAHSNIKPLIGAIGVSAVVAGMMARPNRKERRSWRNKPGCEDLEQNPETEIQAPPRPCRSRSRERIARRKCTNCGRLNLPNDYISTPCGQLVCRDHLSNCYRDHLDMCSFCVPDVDAAVTRKSVAKTTFCTDYSSEKCEDGCCDSARQRSLVFEQSILQR